MKFEIKNRRTGETQITAEIECEEDTPYSKKLGLAILWAVKNDLNLTGTNLRGANLSGANMMGANLSEADMSEADMSWANLSEADMRGAYMSGADMRGADMSGANMMDADLYGTNLSGANLNGVNIKDKTLRIFKHDFWGILLRFPDEIDALIDFIKKGKIDGTCYTGECSCLMGSLANITHKDIFNEEFSNLKDSTSPIEKWFSMIKEGDNPENNFASQKVAQWAEEFLQLKANLKIIKE